MIKTYIIRNKQDDNDTFEVSGSAVTDAAIEALEVLGYSITEKIPTKEPYHE